jgi:hypothetical protein
MRWPTRNGALSTKASQLSVIPGGKPQVVSDDLVGAVQRYVDAVVAPLREKIMVQQIEIEALKARPQPHIRGVIDRNGDLVLTFGDGTVCNVGRVVGRDGKDGEPGLGFDDLELARVDESERKFVLRMTRGDKVKEFSLFFPVPLYRGIWKEGVQLYRVIWSAAAGASGSARRRSPWARPRTATRISP